MSSLLKILFEEISCNHSNNPGPIEKLWNEIEENYSDKSRHYHNLSHLENLLSLLGNVKDQITDWDTVVFAVFYHDIIYKATSDKNEEKSAELAEERLTELSFPNDKISKCVAMIMATKGHSISNDHDTNYFTDADLSILGHDREKYQQYAKQIRKEYSIYPDLIYKPGRKKVLNHFLTMDRIYKTDYFFDRFEKQAKENLMNELKSL